MTSSQLDKLWCLEYDEISYYAPMVEINFSKFLNNIISNKYFPAFEIQAARQIKDEREWNERCWNTLQMFEFLNDAFGSKQFQSQVRFKSQKKTRKMIGSFRMWIDLQRLYLLCFLKMDSIQFQKDRIFFSLYRMMNFLLQFLAEYPLADFKFQYLSKVSSQVTYLTQKLSKSLPDDMVSLIKCIAQIFPNFLLKKDIMVDTRQRDEIKKVAYKKINREYDMIPQVQQRLNINIRVKSKQQQIRQIQHITNSQQIQEMLTGVQQFYDIVKRANNQYEKKYPSEVNNMVKKQQFVKNFIHEIKQRDKQKDKDKGNKQNIYQSLMRVGHNPYQQSNYAMFGQILGININEKKDYQNCKIEEEAEQQPLKQNKLYHDGAYIDQIQKIKIDSVAVTKNDLNFQFFNKKKLNYFFTDNASLFKNLKWQKKMKQNSQQNQSQLSPKQQDLNVLNLKKKLQNNALFMRDDYQQFQQNFITGKYDSNLLNQLDKKKQKIWDFMEIQKQYSLISQSTIDKNIFDSLRKVAQYHSINNKIDKQIKKSHVPAFYPRGIDQIRRYYVDSSIKTTNIQKAINNIDLFN